jgi:hypothetical protein
LISLANSACHDEPFLNATMMTGLAYIISWVRSTGFFSRSMRVLLAPSPPRGHAPPSRLHAMGKHALIVFVFMATILLPAAQGQPTEVRHGSFFLRLFSFLFFSCPARRRPLLISLPGSLYTKQCVYALVHAERHALLLQHELCILHLARNMRCVCQRLSVSGRPLLRRL